MWLPLWATKLGGNALRLSLLLACMLLLPAVGGKDAPMPHRSRAVSVTTMSAVSTPRRRGVILWAYGRSATDTFCGTLLKTARFAYCNGRKEGFNEVHPEAKPLTRSNLGACARRGQMLTHVKPGHLLDGPAPNNTTGGIYTPEQLFGAAKDFGYQVVVATYRRNALARDVSSMELRRRKEKQVRAHWCDVKVGNRTGLAARYADQKALYDRGVRAARTEGLEVFELTFQELIGDVCAAVNRVTRSLEPQRCGKEQVKKICPCKESKTPNKHTRTSHRNKGLAGRTSKDAARCITNSLSKDPEYAWMLDLSSFEPPEGTHGPK